MQHNSPQPMSFKEIKSNLAAITFMLEHLEGDENFIEIRKDEEFDGGAKLTDAIAIVQGLQNSFECWLSV